MKIWHFSLSIFSIGVVLYASMFAINFSAIYTITGFVWLKQFVLTFVYRFAIEILIKLVKAVFRQLASSG